MQKTDFKDLHDYLLLKKKKFTKSKRIVARSFFFLQMYCQMKTLE